MAVARERSEQRAVVILRVALGVAALFVLVAADAQTYPTKAIRFIVPLAPGGGNDTLARQVAQKLTASLGQPVVVENRPGGGTVLASEIVAKSAPDGHTIYLVSTAFTTAPILHAKLPFDTIHDFAPITRLASVPGAMTVHNSLPARSVAQLIALAKKKPGQITFGSSGIGTGSHLAGELLRYMSGIDITHVAYKGSALVTTALLSGEIMLSFSNPLSALPHVKAGRLRILAVTSAQRWPLLPEFPPIAESGLPDYEVLIWQGLVAPAATPQPIIARLHGELAAIMTMPDVVKRLASDAARAMIESPQEFSAFIASEMAKWRKVISAEKANQVRF